MINNFSSSSSHRADCFTVPHIAEDEFSFLDASRLIFVQQIKERSLERSGIDCRGEEFIVSIFQDIGRKMVADQFLPVPWYSNTTDVFYRTFVSVETRQRENN